MLRSGGTPVAGVRSRSPHRLPPAGHRHAGTASLPVLAALCDILELSPAELIVTSAANIAPCNAVSGEALAPVDLSMVRPRRARAAGLDGPYLRHHRAVRRWFIRICARCGRRSSFTARWPDGHVRRTCHDRARPTCGPLLVKPLSPRRHTDLPRRVCVSLPRPAVRFAGWETCRMIASAERRDVIGQVAQRIPAPDGPGCLRVAVDGPDGSGKSTFADELAAAVRALGRRVVRISLDDFHNVRAVRYRQGRESPEGFWQDSYNYLRFQSDVLDPGCVQRRRRPIRSRHVSLAMGSDRALLRYKTPIRARQPNSTHQQDQPEVTVGPGQAATRPTPIGSPLSRFTTPPDRQRRR